MNPALPGGALTTDLAADQPTWSVTGRLGYTFVPYGRMQQGRDEAPNPTELSIDVHLATLQAIATAPTGTSLDVQLPAGSLITSTREDNRRDQGIGDLELRARQSLSRLLAWSKISVGMTAGLVIPTAPYVARSGAANPRPEASYLTLGRGITWGLLEMDVRIPVASRWTGLVQLAGRVPLVRAGDGFEWGSEARLTAAIVLAARARLSVVASTDVQWRGGATEPDPFSGMRTTSANAGGWQWTVAPSLVANVSRELSITGGVRIPVVNDVTGNQLVPETGAFVAVSYTHRAAPARTPARVEVGSTTRPPGAPPARFTVVDYWASWCGPCHDIDRALDAAAARWPDVRIVRVDASSWPGEGAPALPEGITGLPVVEVLDAAGARVLLLVGEDALRVVEKVDALRQPRGL